MIRSNRRNLNTHLDRILEAAGASDTDDTAELRAALAAAVGYCRALTRRLEAMAEAGNTDGASVSDIFSVS